VAIQYLLPCSCGQSVPVETRQAGGTVVCRCGQKLDIPRLLELKKLEKVVLEADRSGRGSSWGPGHSISLIGVLILVVAGLFAVRLIQLGVTNPYERLTLEQIKTEFAKMTPDVTWQTWNFYKQIGINPEKQRIDRVIEAEYEQRQMLLVYLGIAGFVGLVITVSGVVLIMQKRKRPSGGVPS
jgi:uncharacterized protein YxeA